MHYRAQSSAPPGPKKPENEPDDDQERDYSDNNRQRVLFDEVAAFSDHGELSASGRGRTVHALSSAARAPLPKTGHESDESAPNGRPPSEPHDRRESSDHGGEGSQPNNIATSDRALLTTSLHPLNEPNVPRAILRHNRMLSPHGPTKHDQASTRAAMATVEFSTCVLGARRSGRAGGLPSGSGLEGRLLWRARSCSTSTRVWAPTPCWRC